MLRRTGFKRQAVERCPLPAPKPVRRVAPTIFMDLVQSQPKGETAKPGKRAPTAVEREWMDAIVRYGCIACRLDGVDPRPTAVHHILRGGVRMGHMFTLGLCDPGHHQGGQTLNMVSRHPWKARFEARYGTEFDLLEILRNSVVVQHIRVRAAIKTGATL